MTERTFPQIRASQSLHARSAQAEKPCCPLGIAALGIASVFALLASPNLARAEEAVPSETTYVTAARMVDVIGGRIIANPLIAVRDGRILAISDSAATTLPTGAKVTDFAGMTLLPGLIDMHVHIDYPPSVGGYNAFQYTDSFWAITAAGHARSMLESGFTTIRNLGSDARNDVALKQAVEAGFAIGPRIVPAGYSIGATGGHCDSNMLPPSLEGEKDDGTADGAEEMRYQVRRQRKFGAEVIKICATGGVFSKNTEPGQRQLGDAELRALVDEAHQWGLRVAAHAHGTEGIKAVIAAGVDTVEHASLVDDEGIRMALARQRPVWFSMDIYNTEYTQAEGKKIGLLEETIRKDREIAEIQRSNFRKAHAAGVRMVFGSDAGVLPHATATGQFKVMVHYGMTPMEVIQSATRNAAEALGRESDVGAIAVGRFADIIAVDGDPLKDIRELEDVDAVVLGGHVVRARK